MATKSQKNTINQKQSVNSRLASGSALSVSLWYRFDDLPEQKDSQWTCKSKPHGRRILTSTSLDVGEPILKKMEMPLKLEAPPKKWLIPAMFSTEKTIAGNQEHLIVLMMIRRLK